MMKNEQTVAVVLAAGKGTRMKTDMPKVAVHLLGRPMLVHVLDHLAEAGIQRVVVVVGHKKEEVIRISANHPGMKVEFVEQVEQKGTGHAVLVTEPALGSFHGRMLVTCGDMPMVSGSTFRKMIEEHESSANTVTVLSSMLENPFGYGRLVRDASGNLERIVEEKEADESVKKIREVNAGTYVFPCPDVFGILKEIGSANTQNEYYLPDVVAISRRRGLNVGSVIADASESMGVNSMEDLARLEEKARTVVP